MNSLIVTVRVIPNCPVEELHAYDRQLPLEVDMKLDEGVSKNEIADAALDAFHLENPIKILDDFDIEVWYKGEQLEARTNIKAPV